MAVGFVNITSAFMISNSRNSDINDVIFFVDCPATFAFCCEQSYTNNHLSQRVYFLREPRKYMYLLRLSPTMTFLPSRCFTKGTIKDSNQSLKHCASNQPLLLRLYRVFGGPLSIHADHRCSALYTTYASSSCPAAYLPNIMDVEVLVLSFTLSDISPRS